MSYFEQIVAVGNLTHNNVAPTSNNVGALVAVASAAAPVYTAADQVLLSVDLAGNLRITGAITNTYLDYSLATIDADIKSNIILHAGTNVIGKVSQDTNPWIISGAVTNTYLDFSLATIDADIKSNITLHAGANVIGKVSQDTSPWVISGAVTTSGTATVSGTVTAEIVGHAGVTIDAVLAATKPANVLQVGGNDGTNAYAIAMGPSGRSTIIEGFSGGVPVDIRPASPKTGNWTQIPISFSASGASIIVPGVLGQTVRVMRLFFVNCSSTTSTNITIQDTTPTSFTGAVLLISAGTFNGIGDGEPLYTSASGKGIQINSSSAVQISGSVWYTQSA